MSDSRTDPGLPYENLIAVAAGLAWIAAGDGVPGLIFGALPGVLMVAGGVASLLLPGDIRTPQLIALGAVAGVLCALPMIFIAGFFQTLGLLVLAAASFLACGWTAQRREPPIERVPEPTLDLELALKVAIDQLALASMIATRPGRFNRDIPRAAREAREAHELYALRLAREARGPNTASRRRSRIRDHVAAQLRSGVRAHVVRERLRAAPGRARSRALARLPPQPPGHAWVMRHSNAQRPWLVCIHGYGMGSPAVDLGAFEARRLHQQLGLNLLFPVLPLHGPRKLGWRSGDGFLNGDFLDTIHAEAQAMWDIRRLLDWLRANEATQIGVYGLSLGGYTTALLAGLESDLACAIAGIPATDFTRLTARFAPHTTLREVERLGLDWGFLRDVLSVVSPLHIAPKLDKERLAIFGGTADHLVPADQVRDLWKHWGEPRMA
jgi:hypothetical protein